MANIFKNIFGENDETEYDRHLEKYNNSREDLIKLLSENKIIENKSYEDAKKLLKDFHSILCKMEDFSDSSNSLGITVTTKHPLTLKFKPQEKCGGGTYIQSGAQLDVIDITEDKKWYKVNSEGSKGWINSKDVIIHKGAN